MLWIVDAADKILYPVRHRQGIYIDNSSPFSIGIFLSCVLSTIGCPRLILFFLSLLRF